MNTSLLPVTARRFRLILCIFRHSPRGGCVPKDPCFRLLDYRVRNQDPSARCAACYSCSLCAYILSADSKEKAHLYTHICRHFYLYIKLNGFMHLSPILIHYRVGQSSLLPLLSVAFHHLPFVYCFLVRFKSSVSSWMHF